mmetsp:Transcript_116022/g.248032  ORF Transcript_116022/g.248032 Transcript_116022/m.248032 type:complete len:319 (+) Transcript_116022:290-1246(+)
MAAREVQVEDRAGPPRVALEEFLELPSLLLQGSFHLRLREGGGAVLQPPQLHLCGLDELICLCRVALETNAERALPLAAKRRRRCREVITHRDRVDLPSLEAEHLDEACLEHADEETHAEELPQFRLGGAYRVGLRDRGDADGEADHRAPLRLDHLQVHLLTHRLGWEAHVERRDSLTGCHLAEPLRYWCQSWSPIWDRAQILLEDRHERFSRWELSSQHKGPFTRHAGTFVEDRAGLCEVEPSNAPQTWQSGVGMVLIDAALHAPPELRLWVSILPQTPSEEAELHEGQPARRCDLWLNRDHEEEVHQHQEILEIRR